MDIEKCEYCGNDVFRAIKVTKWVYERRSSIYGAWQCQKCHVAFEMEWQQFKPILEEMEGINHGTKA